MQEQQRALVVFHMSHERDWKDGIVNRNYHVFQGLIERGDFDIILGVDFLPFTRKKKLKSLVKNGFFMSNANTVFHNASTRVDRVGKGGSEKGKDNDEGGGTTLYQMSSLNTKDFDDVLKALNIDPQTMVLWSYNPFTSELLDSYEYATVVFDAVDNWIEHPAYTDFQKTLTAHYDRIRKRADVIFTVSEGLVDFFGKKEHVLYIPNGVDAPHFAAGDPKKLSTDIVSEDARKQLQKAGTTVVGYHGVIQSRVNIKILEFLAERQPDTHLLIAGPVWKDVEKQVSELGKKANVHLLGPVPYDQLPHLIALFDVAIIPHKIDRFTNSMNPLKMYEYLAAGKPIVSTAIAGADAFTDVISLAISAEEFSAAVSEAAADDTDTLRKRRQDAVVPHSWEHRVKVMSKAVVGTWILKQQENEEAMMAQAEQEAEVE